MESGRRLMSPAMLSMERGRVQYFPAVSRLHTSNNTQGKTHYSNHTAHAFNSSENSFKILE